MALNKASAIIKEGLAVHDWPKAITKALGLVRVPIKRVEWASLGIDPGRNNNRNEEDHKRLFGADSCSVK